MLIYDLKNGQKICIRRAQESDSKELVSMSIKMGGESDNLTFGIDDYYLTEDQHKILISNIKQRDNCLYIVAVLNNKIVGSLSFLAFQRKRMMHRGDLGIGVLKDYWSLGIGSALMDYFFKWAYTNGTIKKIDLQVREDNITAINLYNKFGFKIEGKITRGMNVDNKYYDIYYMGKNI